MGTRAGPPTGVQTEIARALEQLAAAERVEHIAARLYAALAARFPDRPDAAALFQQLEAEEEQHALRIASLATSYAQDPSRYGELQLDRGRLEQLQRDGEALLVTLEAFELTLDLERALELSAQLEERFGAAHAQVAVAQSSPALREFFEIFVAQDRAHAALLRRGRSDRGPAAGRPRR
jgi:rubrerythrin